MIAGRQGARARDARRREVRRVWQTVGSATRMAGSWLAGLTSCAAVAWAAPPAPPVDYVRDVRPILQQACVRCHGPEKHQASLRLDARGGILQGGDSGPAVVPGDSELSILVRAIRGADDVSRMPPETESRQLTPRELDLLEAWVAQGAQGPQEGPLVQHRRSSDHWSFQPIVCPPLPATPRDEWARNPLDHFIAAGHESQGLAPAPEADRVTLIRRLYLDLVGVTPAPEEVDQFLADARPDAYERLVERLLASPQFGERAARRWLDLARYADSNGFTRDMPREIWPYRDWVIRAFNANMPFDQFTIEQLAGDLLPDTNLSQLVATGFHRNTLFNEEGGTDPEQFRVERTVDRVNTTSTALLGLTIGCAQCHDHKYDPVTQREFFQLYAFFNNADEPQVDVPSPRQIAADEPRRYESLQRQIAELEREFTPHREELERAEQAWEMQLTEDEKKQLPFQVLNAINLARAERTAELNRHLYDYFQALVPTRHQFPLLEEIYQLRQKLPQFATTMVIRERAEPRVTQVQIRGDFLRTGARVYPTTPDVLPPLAARGEIADRLDLARWLVASDNPLTPRVTVNRLWLQLFGRGLVETENDFGLQGTPPSHPQLLDWLAHRFVASGWDVKGLYRLLVTSATYRQASAVDPRRLAQDPANVWYARQSRLRLDAEIIRDSGLSASGLLTSVIGGESVYPPQPEGVFDFTQDKKPWPTASGADRFRRGMYTYLWRSSPYPAMTVFDFPDANTACTRRLRSNTPLQSLTLANDPVVLELARALAERSLRQEPASDSERIGYLFRCCLVRTPQPAELTRLGEYFTAQRAYYVAAPDAARELLTPASGDVPPQEVDAALCGEQAAWVALARVLLNLDEFVTRE